MVRKCDLPCTTCLSDTTHPPRRLLEDTARSFAGHHVIVKGFYAVKPFQWKAVFNAWRPSVQILKRNETTISKSVSRMCTVWWEKHRLVPKFNYHEQINNRHAYEMIKIRHKSWALCTHSGAAWDCEKDKPISVNSVIKATLTKEWLKCSVKLSQNDVNFVAAAICIVLSIFPRVNCGKNNTRGGMFAFVSSGWFIPATILYPWRKDRRDDFLQTQDESS